MSCTRPYIETLESSSKFTPMCKYIFLLFRYMCYRFTYSIFIMLNHTKNLCLWWCKMRCSSLCKFLQSFVACTLLGSNIFFSCMFFNTLSFLIYQRQRRNVNLIQTICSVSDFLICQGRCRQNSKYWTLRGGGLCALLLQVFHPHTCLVSVPQLKPYIHPTGNPKR